MEKDTHCHDIDRITILIDHISLYRFEIEALFESIRKDKPEVLKQMDFAELRRFQRTFDKSIGHLRKAMTGRPEKPCLKRAFKLFLYRILKTLFGKILEGENL